MAFRKKNSIYGARVFSSFGFTTSERFHFRSVPKSPSEDCQDGWKMIFVIQSRPHDMFPSLPLCSCSVLFDMYRAIRSYRLVSPNANQYLSPGNPHIFAQWGSYRTRRLCKAKGAKDKKSAVIETSRGVYCML